MSKQIVYGTQIIITHKYKMVGWCLLILATTFGIILIISGLDTMPIKTTVFAIIDQGIFEKSQSFTFININITKTIVGVIFIIGALFVGFSREKKEDEFIANLRLSSLLWAVVVNYVLLLFSFVFIYGAAFLDVMMYNMFTVMIIFIVRFNYILYKNSNPVTDEK